MGNSLFAGSAGQRLCIPARLRDCRILLSDHTLLTIGTLYDRSDENTGLILPDPDLFLPTLVLVDDLGNRQISRFVVVWREGSHAGLAPVSLPQDTRFGVPEIAANFETWEETEWFQDQLPRTARWLH